MMSEDKRTCSPKFLAGTPLTVLWRARSMQDEDETCSSSHTPIPMMTSQSSQESAPVVKSTVLKTVDNQHKHHCCADGEDEVTTTEQASLDREVGDTSLPENIDNSSHTHPQEILRKCIATGEASDAPIVLRSESGCHYDEEQEEDEEHCHNERTKTHRKCCGAPDCQLDWSFVEKGRLYGCTQVIQKLERAFHRRLDQSLQQEQRSSFILISGISGTGKSAVAKAALEPLATKSKGYYLYGKFDSLQRPEPYAPFVHAVIEFVCRVLEQHSVTVSSPVPHHQRQSPGLSAAGTGLLYNIQSESFCLLDQLKREIQGALSIEGCSLLTSMVPALSHILGTSQYNAGNTSTSSALEPSQDRLKVTFRRFLQAICRPTRPFVFVLDDLQWADASSLDLLECLVCDTENTSLVLVGICRSNEVSQDHKLASMMRRLEDEQNIRIDSIVTKNLSYRATNQLIADVLRQPAHICEPLTDTIHWKTKGNVFYVINYLKALHADKILLPDHEYGTGGWLWDEERWNELYCSSTTKADGAGENNVDECSQEESHVAAVIKLISRQMQRLPEDTQLVLRICACIGAEIDLNLLKKVLADVNLKRATQIAVDEGLLVAKDWYQTRQLPLRLRHSPTPKTIPSMKGNYFMFAHDVVQQAAYSLISDQRKSAVHLSIGRMLFKNMQSIGEFNEHIFVVVNQMSRGMTHINDQLEKDGLAALCLKAGNRAILSSDFHTAVQYFVLGTTLLSQGDNYWSRQYELSLELYNSLAEAEYCVADFEMMDLAIDEVFRHGRNFRDTIRAYATKVYSLGARFMLQEAIDVGLKVLERFGEKFPSSRPREASSLHALSEPMKIRRKLSWKTKSQLLDLPDMNHPDKVAAMGILNLLTTYSMIGRPSLFPYIAARLVKLSLSYGLCAISAPGFAFYGVWLCSIGDTSNGYKYGQLALDVLDRYESTITEWVPRVYSVFYGMIAHWRQPLSSTLEPTLHAHRIGLETGDIEYAMIGAHVYSMNAFMSGEPLPALEGKMKKYVELMNTYKQGPWAAATSVQLQMIHNLMGRASNPLVLRGEIMTDDKVREVATVRDMESYESYFVQVMVWRLLLAYHFGNLELALSIASESRQAINGLGSFLVSVHCFYDGLTALLAASHTRYQDKRRVHLSVARKALKKLRMLGRHCSENCKNKICLLEAEFAASRGDVDKAVMLYNKSISLAQKEGFIHEEALAHERAGTTLQSALYGKQCLLYLHKALHLYQEWGAIAKVDHMQKNFQMPRRR